MPPLLILRVCGISLLASTPLHHSQLGSLEECCAEGSVGRALFFGLGNFYFCFTVWMFRESFISFG